MHRRGASVARRPPAGGTNAAIRVGTEGLPAVTTTAVRTHSRQIDDGKRRPGHKEERYKERAGCRQVRSAELCARREGGRGGREEFAGRAEEHENRDCGCPSVSRVTSTPANQNRVALAADRTRSGRCKLRTWAERDLNILYFKSLL